MTVQHRFTLRGTCPVDGAEDSYVVTVLADRVVPVESIREAAASLTVAPIFQEDLTTGLATRLGPGVRVRTVGVHGTTRTKCSAGELRG